MPNWKAKSLRNADAKVRMHLAASETLRERVIQIALSYYEENCDTGCNALNSACAELREHLDNQPKPNAKPIQEQ